MVMIRMALLAAVSAVTGCAQGPTPEQQRANEERAKGHQMVQEALRRAREQQAGRRVNENWSAWCTIDQVTTVRHCQAIAWGYQMSSAGQPIKAAGSGFAPLAVSYFDSRGPYLTLGRHDFPGRLPTLRLDDGQPQEVDVKLPRNQVVSELRTAKVARVRFHVWPRGPQDMHVALDGIDEALTRLEALRTAPR